MTATRCVISIRGLAPLVAGLLLALGPRGVAAQAAEASAVLSGRAVVGEDGPLASVRVTLHRVAAHEAGEVDSVFTATDGTFAIPLPNVPDAENRSEVFFASVRHQGVLYFGQAVSNAAQLDSAYLIQAYDTVLAPAGGAPVEVRVRNVFLEENQGGWRVTDLFQLANDGDRTLVARSEDVTWAYPLPSGARDFELGQGDLAPEQISFGDGQVQVAAPLPPGERVVVIRYALDGLAAAVPMPGNTTRAEVLIREPAPSLELRGLTAQTPVELEAGTSYRRYVGDSISGVTATLLPVDVEEGLPLGWLTVIMALALAGVAVMAFRRGQSDSPATAAEPAAEAPSPADERELILLAIARLDEARHRGEEPDEAYQRKRQELLDRLANPGT